MIVKKMPIFQGFPDFETVKKLSGFSPEIQDFNPVFYDIETTGLSRNSTFLYLIGAVAYDGKKWNLYQWFCENSDDEQTVLVTFSNFMKIYNFTIQYNGDNFDQPYLEARYAFYKLPSPFEGISSLDLYKKLKPVKGLLKLSRMNQPSMEAFLGIQERNFCDGGACIRLYRQFISGKKPENSDIVLGHNCEDLLGLGKIFSMLSYLELFEDSWEISDCRQDEELVLFTLSVHYRFPAEFSNGGDGFYITGSHNRVKFSIKSVNGRLRQYYSNYRDYDYIPSEDTVIPKSLSVCMDKSLKQPARKDTCYTWFPVTEEFLKNRDMEKDYLRHAFAYYLKNF